MGRRVRVVVLNYNGGAHVERCVDALEAVDWPDGELEIVLIDNASTDGSADAVAVAHPDVHVVRNETNLGFVANNLALRDLAGLDYVALVNNDAFVDPGWLTPLVEALDADPWLGAVQSRILFADRFIEIEVDSGFGSPGLEVRGLRVDGRDRFGDLQVVRGGGEPYAEGAGIVHPLTDRSTLRVPAPTAPTGSASGEAVVAELLVSTPRQCPLTFACGSDEVVAVGGPVPAWVSIPLTGEPVDVINNVGGVVTTDGHGADRGWLEPDVGQFDEPAEIFAWCGGSVLLRPSYLHDVGLFDEELFLYYEDTDLSWRGRALGWRYAYEPRSVVRHLHAASSGTASPMFRFYNERNRLLVLVRNAPAELATRAAVRQPLTTLSYARRDIAGPVRRGERPDWRIVRVRLAAFASFLAHLPRALVARRTLRGDATVEDDELTGWFVPRE